MKQDNISRVLITGGAGFVGTALARVFTASGWDVTLVDNLMMQPLQTSVGTLKVLDVLDLTLADLEGFACIYHLASYKSVPQSFLMPMNYFSNAQMVTHLLQLVKETGQRLVIISTCETYGQARQQPISETAELLPLSPYAVSKASGDMMARVYQQAYNLPVTVARLFNVYGPGAHPNAVIPAFCCQLLMNNKIRIEGDGHQMRNFTFVTDVAHMLFELHQTVSESLFLNIGSEITISVSDIANDLLDIHGCGEISYTSKRLQEITIFDSDNTLTQQVIDYVPRQSWLAGLAETYAWYAERYQQSPLKEAIQSWGILEHNKK